MASFSERLKQLREQHGLLQRELADKFNLARVTITNYENGTRFPEPDTLIKFADFFNVSVDYLIGRSDNPKRMHNSITENIMRIRRQKGISIKELAIATGLSPEDILDIEAGRKMVSAKGGGVHLFAEALEVKPSELLEGGVATYSQKDKEVFEEIKKSIDGDKEVTSEATGPFFLMVIRDLLDRLDSFQKASEGFDADKRMKFISEYGAFFADTFEREKRLVESVLDEWEAWHLASGPYADAAREIICQIVHSHFPSLIPKLKVLNADSEPFCDECDASEPEYKVPSTLAAHTVSGNPLEAKAADEVGHYISDKVKKIKEEKARRKEADNSEKGD